MTSRSKILSFALLCVAAALGIVLSPHHSAKTPQLATGTLLAPARPLADFSLIDNHGRAFGPAELRAAKTPAPPRVIFVSVDAERDTPAQLDKYVPYFDPEFIGLTATDQSNIEAIARKWHVAVAVQPAADGNFTLDHSDAIYVVDPSGRLAAILTGPFTVEALGSDYRQIVSAGA